MKGINGEVAGWKRKDIEFRNDRNMIEINAYPGKSGNATLLSLWAARCSPVQGSPGQVGGQLEWCSF